MNTTNLIRWAGVSAMAAGSFYVIVGMFHPANHLSSVNTQWTIIHTLATAMCLLFLPGITGIYVRQAKAAGWLGLASFLLYSLSWMLTALFTFTEAFILPLLAAKTPALAEDFLGIFTSSAGNMNFGFLTTLWTLTGLLYMLGGALFGLATFRAGILPRWAAILLVIGSALAPVAALLPLEQQPKVALPVGIALAWLGYALWSERREYAAESVPGRASPQTRPEWR